MVFCNATSGSCMIRTKVTVLAGTLVHSSLGETGLASDCVYLLGISAPSENAGLVSVIPGPDGPLPILPLSCATAEPVAAASRIVKNVILVVLIVDWRLAFFSIALITVRRPCPPAGRPFPSCGESYP